VNFVCAPTGLAPSGPLTTTSTVPVPAGAVTEDVFERRTPDGRIVGIMVLNFSRHDQGQLRLPLAVTAVAVK